MSSAPKLVIQSVTFAAVLACTGFVAFADPVYDRLKRPFTNPISSTFIVAALAAAIIGAAWWIFVASPRNAEPPISSPPVSVTNIRILKPYEVGKRLRVEVTINSLVAGLTLRAAHFVEIGIADSEAFSEQRKGNENARWERYEHYAKDSSPIPLKVIRGQVVQPIEPVLLNEAEIEALNNPNCAVHVMGQMITVPAR